MMTLHIMVSYAYLVLDPNFLHVYNRLYKHINHFIFLTYSVLGTFSLQNLKRSFKLFNIGVVYQVKVHVLLIVSKSVKKQLIIFCQVPVGLLQSLALQDLGSHVLQSMLVMSC